jgi:hypothetical protein
MKKWRMLHGDFLGAAKIQGIPYLFLFFPLH